MSNRYFIDERGGCIAVRDREQTDPDYNGLHPVTPGVVWYEPGVHEPQKCPHCGSVTRHEWKLKPGARERAEIECSRLNKEPTDE